MQIRCDVTLTGVCDTKVRIIVTSLRVVTKGVSVVESAMCVSGYVTLERATVASSGLPASVLATVVLSAYRSLEPTFLSLASPHGTT